MILPDIAAEEAFLEDGTSAVLLKLSTGIYEVNIFVARPAADHLVLFLNGSAKDFYCAGVSAGDKVHWRLDGSHLYIMIGEDDVTWDIGFTLDRSVARNISEQIEALCVQPEPGCKP